MTCVMVCLLKLNPTVCVHAVDSMGVVFLQAGEQCTATCG